MIKQDGMAETVSYEVVAVPFLNTSVCAASPLASWPHALAYNNSLKNFM